MSNIIYPGIADREKAVAVDGFIFIVLMFVFAEIFASLNYEGSTWRIVAAIGMVFLYEPLLVFMFKGTIGHLVMGLRVTRDNEKESRLPIPLGIFRIFVKVLLGAISLMTIYNNEKGKAIHDKAVNSVVKYRKPK